MKTTLLGLALLVLFAAGCTEKTEFGNCVGLDGKKDPKLEYKLSVNNIVVAVVFAELIVPPVIVVVDQLYCPVGKVE